MVRGFGAAEASFLVASAGAFVEPLLLSGAPALSPAGASAGALPAATLTAILWARVLPGVGVVLDVEEAPGLAGALAPPDGLLAAESEEPSSVEDLLEPLSELLASCLTTAVASRWNRRCVGGVDSLRQYNWGRFLLSAASATGSGGVVLLRSKMQLSSTAVALIVLSDGKLSCCRVLAAP